MSKLHNHSREYTEHLTNVRRRAGEILFILDAPEREGLLTEAADSSGVLESMMDAARHTSLFNEFQLTNNFLRPIMANWSRAYRRFVDTHQRYPSHDVLANAHQSFQNLMRGSVRVWQTGENRVEYDNMLLEDAKGISDRATHNAFFESAFNGPDMSRSDGVERLAMYAALVLPVQLGSETQVLASMIPAPSTDENKYFKLFNVASNDFGSYKAGDELDMQSAGVYSQMMRIYVLPAAKQPDGTKTKFTFQTKDAEGSALPVRPGRVRIQINRAGGDYDDERGHASWHGDLKGKTINCSADVDYLNGKVDMTFATAPDADIEISILCELDVELKPDMIPCVNQAMLTYTVKPSQYVLATQHSIQSLSDAQREFGLDLGGMATNLLTQSLIHEADVSRLRQAAFYARDVGSVDVSYPASGDRTQWSTLLAGRIHRMSSDMCRRTKSTGITGMFVGADATSLIVSLAGTAFKPVSTPLVISPYIQYIGKLFDLYDVYSVPDTITRQFEKDPISPVDFNRRDILFFGRGQGLLDAPLVGGDAIPAIPIQHPTNADLVNRVTIYGQAVNCLNPDNGRDYVIKCRLASVNTGFIDPFAGGIN